MNDDYYLPMDCPNCGRARLMAQPARKGMWCEKCNVSHFDCLEDEHEAGGPHRQFASAWRFTRTDIGL